MKHLMNLLSVFLLLFSFSFSAQEIGGKITYKAKNLSAEDRYAKYKESDPETYRHFMAVSQQIAEAKAQLIYTLDFNSKAAVFIAEPILGKGNNIAGGFQRDTGIYYNSIDEQKRFHQTELKRELYIVEHDPLKWQITGETKKVGEYTAVRAVSSQIFYRFGEKENLIQDIEAWFVPEIPVSFGPKGYGGLPGLIVDITVAGERLYATNIS